ncbi:hypothetical protein DRE_05147 [Drechslerella stenobrocha 248]|uniref:C2 domain-containing protein n=1 Tax=Drechslerella stenobrocha 248 TaxID=1043628 RepID=W7I9T3_9PEZI|nr:hypothetical protein DRE_05147 [Drechslerella stenobrocha 248]
MSQRWSTHDAAGYYAPRELANNPQSRQGSHVSIVSARRVAGTQATPEHVYSHALRIGFLNYLLQPRKRKAVAPAPVKTASSYSSSAGVLMAEFTTGSKSAKLPKVDFMTVLQRRLEGVMTGREPGTEFKDHLVKRTFAIFLNEIMKPDQRKLLSKSRRAEDMILVFISRGTSELQSAVMTGGLAGVTRENVGLLVDRHVALFIRLLVLCLKDNGWASNHAELVKKLSTLESRMLAHDRNLVDAQNSAQQPAQITEEVPLSYDVREMPYVQTVARIFRLSLTQAQNDVNRNRQAWSDAIAMKELKLYGARIHAGAKATLTADDFDTDEAYETWKVGELEYIPLMQEAMVTANPGLASIDINGDQVNGFQSNTDGAEGIFTFIPPNPREYFRVLLKMCFDNHAGPAAESESDDYHPPVLSFEELSLIEACAVRWRIPAFSKGVMVLSLIREMYTESRADLDTIDKAFEFIKASVTTPWQYWTIPDQNLQRKSLSSFYDNILRELYHAVMQCFETKPPSLDEYMYILTNHLYPNPLFSAGKDLDTFIGSVKDGLKVRAEEVYAGFTKTIPENREEWDMYHIVELGKKLIGLIKRLAKRFPEPILGKVKIDFLTIESIFPAFAEDAENIIKGIFRASQEQGEELEIQDAFDMYQGLVEVRDIHDQVIKNPFPFDIEKMIQDFVWRWLGNIDSKVVEWVENALRQDEFNVKSENGALARERHSISVEDVFRSFTQNIKALKDLNWADEYQEAKFFTALSKSIGTGLMHYCDKVEAIFTMEMDRLTPEQEAARNKTQKEKLLAYFNSKEKVDPFNFLPESCVKFNNIEYAIHQLDLLEKSINVDRCAAIIQKHTPVYQPKKQSSNKYLFTIKIVEAEDLKACDMNGFSDPYVVLGDEYRKRLAKTRVIYTTLNPRFEETVEITTTGPVLLTATIWDHDTVGEHDYVGRAPIKLDPSFFGDYEPREFWLDLDTQGRLLLKISMEGERDDIQFYFGRTFRTLKRTERDMARQITDKCSPFIKHCLSRQALRSILNPGITMASVSSYFSRTGFGSNRPQSVVKAGPTDEDVANALTPLFTYFNENFEILDKTLTHEALINVMAKLWKEVLATIEAMMVPPLSDKPSNQKPLSSQELDVAFKWLKLLFEFFSAPDEQGQSTGVPVDILKSPKYHDLQSLGFWYPEATENLIRTSDRIAGQNNARLAEKQKSLQVGPPSSGSLLLAPPMAKRSKSVLNNRNLGTMRKAKEEKRKEAQAEANDDMILRILRMRPDASGYLRARSQQKERIAAQKAAEAIVAQSINAGVGRMTAGGVGGVGSVGGVGRR